jgi:hypothetical protein
MIAIKQMLCGIAVAHALWAYFFTCGTLLRRPVLSDESSAPVASAQALLHIILCTAAGIAMLGFFTFLVGVTHLLYPASYAIFTLAVFGAFYALGDSPLRRDFWVTRWNLWRDSCSWPAVVVYIAALVVAIPAYIPDTGSDATAEYLVKAFQWASLHNLIVNPWVRDPYYADNWVLIQTALTAFKLGNFIAFVSWFTGALTMLGVYAAVLVFGWRPGTALDPLRVTAVLAALAMAVNATFLRWVDTPMLDAPLSFFFFTSVVSLLLAIQSKDARFLWFACLSIGFFVGAKISFVFFLPVLLLGLLYAAQRAGMSLKTGAALLTVTLCLCAPWYARNFLLDGDPMAPAFNLAIRGVDAKWSKADANDVEGDLRCCDHSVGSRAFLPLQMFVDPKSPNIRASGAVVLMFAFFLPAVVLAYLLIKRRLAQDGVISYSTIILVCALAYWVGVSHHGRYSLLFVPLLSAYVAVAALLTFGRRKRWLPVVIMLVAAIPSPASAEFYQQLSQEYSFRFWSYYRGVDQWLAPRVAAYPELDYITNEFRARGIVNGNVYGVQTSYMRYFFTRRGITLIGDHYGPERYIDFAYAIRTNAVRQYIQRFGISAFLIPEPDNMTFGPRELTIDDMDRLWDELKSLGYTRTVQPGRYVVYLAPYVDQRTGVKRCCRGTASARTRHPTMHRGYERSYDERTCR